MIQSERERDTVDTHGGPLDVVGDLALLGCALRGRIVAWRSGHALHGRLVDAILAGEVHGAGGNQEALVNQMDDAVREAVREAQIITARSFNYTPYVITAVLFLLISVPVARFADWYTERDRERKAGQS